MTSKQIKHVNPLGNICYCLLFNLTAELTKKKKKKVSVTYSCCVGSFWVILQNSGQAEV